VSGEAHILVLLHPFPMDASFWGPMWRELAADVTVLTPEFPGFGAAPPVDAPTIAAFAGDVADLIRAEGRRPATVVGLSLGGYVALALAHDHPDVVAGLVLANTRAEGDDAAARAARDQAIDTVRIDGLDTYLAGLLPRLLGADAGPDAWDRAQAIAHRQDPQAVCLALEALRDRPDRTGDVGAIGVPTTVIIGSADAVTPREAAQALADGVAGATLAEIDGAGHLSALERPAEFAALVARTLARVDAERTT
jgi:pimeloyl-ACP methyl ester carboxylesterase